MKIQVLTWFPDAFIARASLALSMVRRLKHQKADLGTEKLREEIHEEKSPVVKRVNGRRDSRRGVG